jgi:hypothetical protein
MSHYAVLVIGNDPDFQLAPFDENESVEPYLVGAVSDADKQSMLNFYNEKHNNKYASFVDCYAEHGEDWNGNMWKQDIDGTWYEYSAYNPDSKWDWYILGGRWSGCFIKLKDGATGVMGYSGVFENKVGVDQAYKKDIDFDRIKREAREMAVKTYREIAEKCGGTIPTLPLSWSNIIKSDKYANMSMDEKRTLYHSQEAVKIWKEKVSDSPFGYDIDNFQCSEEEYATRAELNSFIPYAVLYEGEWISRGDMGWWGMTINEHYDENEWQRKVWELIDQCDDDTLFSFYDLHI